MPAPDLLAMIDDARPKIQSIFGAIRRVCEHADEIPLTERMAVCGAAEDVLQAMLKILNRLEREASL